MAGLDEPNFDLFGSFGLEFLEDELLTETDYLTEQTETTETGGVATITEQTEQTVSGQLNDEDIDNFIAENRNKNTTKKTQSDLNVFYRWAKNVNETRTIENIPEQELDKVLAHFFLNVRKTNGDEYEPDTLTSMLRSFDRFLREKEKQYSILTDRQFTKVREALSSKRKQLRRTGKGQKPNKALGLSENQIQKLWDEKQLGYHTPQSLLRTVWFNNTLFFGWRARDEHHRVRFGDFQIKCEDGPQGRDYVEWITERGSKTRTGEHEFVPDRTFNPKMYATGGSRCPVSIFKEYLARRPPEMAAADSPFYLASIVKPSSDIWFKKQPLGKNSLGSFMKSMSEAAGLTGRHTNHSVRRTMISTLRKENVEPLNIIALAGQRNLKSLDSYSSTSTEQQKDMSLKLSSFIEVCDAREKSVAESQILTPRADPQRDESEGKHLFTGAVFNNCQFTFTTADAGSAAVHATVPQKKFKRILPLVDSDDEL